MTENVAYGKEAILHLQRIVLFQIIQWHGD